MRWFLTRVLMIAFPIIEILLIAWVWNTIGWLPTILLLVAGFMIGMILMRAAGVTAFRALSTPIQRHQPYVEIDETTGVAQTVHPAREPSPEEVAQATVELRQSGYLFVAGLLFAVPGFLTDLIGAVLVLPPTRRLLAARSASRPRRTGPTVVVVGETVTTAGETPGTAASPGQQSSDSGAGTGPPVIRGEILPPGRESAGDTGDTLR